MGDNSAGRPTSSGCSADGTGGACEAASTPAPKADSGCSCRTVGAQSTDANAGYAWLLMLSLVSLRRRRAG
jgi:hypothetical protein